MKSSNVLSIATGRIFVRTIASSQREAFLPAGVLGVRESDLLLSEPKNSEGSFSLFGIRLKRLSTRRTKKTKVLRKNQSSKEMLESGHLQKKISRDELPIIQTQECSIQEEESVAAAAAAGGALRAPARKVSQTLLLTPPPSAALYFDLQLPASAIAHIGTTAVFTCRVCWSKSSSKQSPSKSSARAAAHAGRPLVVWTGPSGKVLAGAPPPLSRKPSGDPIAPAAGAPPRSPDLHVTCTEDGIASLQVRHIFWGIAYRVQYRLTS